MTCSARNAHWTCRISIPDGPGNDFSDTPPTTGRGCDTSSNLTIARVASFCLNNIMQITGHFDGQSKPIPYIRVMCVCI